MRVSAPRAVVPGPGLPPDLVLGRSNNNLDVARHDGRLWLGTRTAPTHYASADARLLSVVRKEGPEGGWGSDIATAPAGAPGTWTASHDPRKFDSPYLFLDDGRPYLVARRQVAVRGRYDLGLTWLPDGLRTKVNMLVYALTPKRTAVYRIDPDARSAAWVGDLPSAGDTAFASSVPTADGTGHLVFNYSSPISRSWWPWMFGQLRPTHIYAVEVSELS